MMTVAKFIWIHIIYRFGVPEPSRSIWWSFKTLALYNVYAKYLIKGPAPSLTIPCTCKMISRDVYWPFARSLKRSQTRKKGLGARNFLRPSSRIESWLSKTWSYIDTGCLKHLTNAFGPIISKGWFSPYSAECYDNRHKEGKFRAKAGRSTLHQKSQLKRDIYPKQSMMIELFHL